MNKTDLKNFAVNARRELLKQVSLRANLFGITEKTGLTIEERFGQLMINDNPYPIHMKLAFLSMQKQLEQKGYEQVLEEVAYTWFNRIIAIRYMEVHDYLPERVNVLSSSTGRVDPDILTEYETMELDVDKAKIKEVILNGDIEGAYRLLFIAQCNALNEVLPFMFEKIQDFTELLLPDFLLDRDSILNQLVFNIAEENYVDEKGKANVEILGWLYQYYMSEKKDLIGGLNNSAVKKEDLPAVTQLFTPKWIVEYMIQNSLGKIYDEKFPANTISSAWQYYFKNERNFKILPGFTRLEDVKVLDPACGSGHILVYAFDVLYAMYEEQGYSANEIPKLILENNLYGLEIDKRSVQIANFALIMKATEKQKRFLKKNKYIKTNVIEIVDADLNVPIDALKYISDNSQEIELFKEIQNDFIEAKQFGSLLTPIERNLNEWIERIESLNVEELDLIEQTYKEELDSKVLPLLKQHYILNNKYTVVVTNPPYHNNYNESLKKFLNKNYSDYKMDLYSCFISKCLNMLDKNGYAAFMSPFTWMYLTTYKKLRYRIFSEYNISNLVQLEYSAFKDATVPISTFIIQNQNEYSFGEYLWLDNFKGEANQPLKVMEAKINPSVSYKFRCNNQEFLAIKEYPLIFWCNEIVRNIFIKNETLGDFAEPRQGLATAKDELYLRLWHEVEFDKIGFDKNSREEAYISNTKWFPFNKGGKYRKWYGNQYHVINWENDGLEVRNFNKSVIRNINYYFQEGITWGLVSSGSPSFRYSPNGFIPGHKGSLIYFKDDSIDLFYTLGLLNSKVSKMILKSIAPHIGFEVGHLKRIPIIKGSSMEVLIMPVRKLVLENISIIQENWNYNEFSWGYKRANLLVFKDKSNQCKKAFDKYNNYLNQEFERIKYNEEQLNKIFINLYGLNNELSSEVEDGEITFDVLDRGKNVRQFLSYFVGCILGRFSLECDGVCYAGGEWDDSRYSSFIPNKYGVVQFTDAEYFEHDIIARLREFLIVTFHADTVEENIQWLANALEMKKGEDAEMRLRRYFMDEFFMDHCKIYQKRPIYWLVDSGKQKGLRTLIYMHRYQPDTMATIRFEHLQETQVKYNNEIDAIDLRLVNPNLSTTEKRDLEKQQTVFKKRLEELLEFDKKLSEYANSQIPIDLDDGVVVNHAKFDELLVKIK